MSGYGRNSITKLFLIGSLLSFGASYLPVDEKAKEDLTYGAGMCGGVALLAFCALPDEHPKKKRGYI